PRDDFQKLLAEVVADTGRVVLHRKGQLGAADPRDRVLKQSPHLVHEIKLTAGKRYAVALDRLGAGKFDPYLRLEDDAGKELAQDDDSGGGQNALLVFIPEQTAVYRI